MLTTIWQKFRWHTDGILITAEKFRVRTHHNALRFASVSYITVGLAQARPNYSLEERLGMKKCRRKHGGFRPLLTPHGTYGYRYLPLTNRDAKLLTKSFPPPPWFVQKNYGFLVFGTTSSRKIFSFSLMDAGNCKNNEKMFLPTGKS